MDELKKLTIIFGNLVRLCNNNIQLFYTHYHTHGHTVSVL